MAKCILTASFALLLAISSGCCGPITGLYPPAEDDTREIYLMNNHWHTGFVFPVSELTPAMRHPPLAPVRPPGRTAGQSPREPGC